MNKICTLCFFNWELDFQQIFLKVYGQCIRALLPPFNIMIIATIGIFSWWCCVPDNSSHNHLLAALSSVPNSVPYGDHEDHQQRCYPAHVMMMLRAWPFGQKNMRIYVHQQIWFWSWEPRTTVLSCSYSHIDDDVTCLAKRIWENMIISKYDYDYRDHLHILLFIFSWWCCVPGQENMRIYDHQ